MTNKTNTSMHLISLSLILWGDVGGADAGREEIFKLLDSKLKCVHFNISNENKKLNLHLWIKKCFQKD